MLATLVAYLRACEARGPAAARGLRQDRAGAGGRRRPVPDDRQAARRPQAGRARRRGVRGLACRRQAAPRRHHVGAHDGAARSVGEHAAHHGGLRRRGVRRRRRRHRAALHLGAWASPTPSPAASPATRTWCCRRKARSAASSIRAHGAWFIEKLTDDLAKTAGRCSRRSRPRAAWRAALESGFIQAEIAKVAEARGRDIATGRLELTGVSAFPRLADDGVKVEPHPPPEPVVKGGTSVAPLPPRRLAEPFERLRDAADAHLARTGKRPQVFLASLGDLAAHSARSTWMRNFLAAGGIEAIAGDAASQLRRRRQGLRRQRRARSPASAPPTRSMPSWRRPPPAR